MADENTSKGALTFTEGETALFTAIMENLTSDIQVNSLSSHISFSPTDLSQFDADTVATKLGYKSGKTVKDRWSQIKKKKLGGAVASAASPAGIKKRAPAKETAKKVEKGDDAEGGEEDAGEVAVSKETKKGGGKAKKAKKEAAKAVKEEDTEEVAESIE